MSLYNDWGDPDPDHRDSYRNEPRRQRPYCGECGEPYGPDHDHTGDGQFYCALGHLHRVEPFMDGLTYEHAPCPNDPQSPNAYPEDD